MARIATSWAMLAEEIFKHANKEAKVKRVTTEEYGVSIAKRPFNSRLDKSKLIDNGFKPLPNWKDALKLYLEQVNKGIQNPKDAGWFLL